MYLPDWHGEGGSAATDSLVDSNEMLRRAGHPDEWSRPKELRDEPGDQPGQRAGVGAGGRGVGRAVTQPRRTRAASGRLHGGRHL